MRTISVRLVSNWTWTKRKIMSKARWSRIWSNSMKMAKISRVLKSPSK
jgi:uncharacterized protein (DUF2384 family)